MAVESKIAEFKKWCTRMDYSLRDPETFKLWKYNTGLLKLTDEEAVGLSELVQMKQKWFRGEIKGDAVMALILRSKYNYRDKGEEAPIDSQVNISLDEVDEGK